MVYLAMFIRTEPQLFHEMLRLRVGLIIQVSFSPPIKNDTIKNASEYTGNGKRAFANVKL